MDKEEALKQIKQCRDLQEVEKILKTLNIENGVRRVTYTKKISDEERTILKEKILASSCISMRDASEKFGFPYTYMKRFFGSDYGLLKEKIQKNREEHTLRERDEFTKKVFASSFCTIKEASKHFKTDPLKFRRLLGPNNYGVFKRKAKKLFFDQFIKKRAQGILDLASKKNKRTLQEVGRYLGLTRERIRQIVHLAGMTDQLQEVFKKNIHGTVILPMISGVYSVYFQNDPKKQKYYGYGTNLKATSVSLLRILKRGEKKFKRGWQYKDKLFNACEKFGIENIIFELEMKCPNKGLRKVADHILRPVLKDSLNMRPFILTASEIRELHKERQHCSLIKSPKKKSKYYGVYYHRLSKLWGTHPKNLLSGKGQKSLGYFHKEKEAKNAVFKWIKSIELECRECGRKWSPQIPPINNYCTCGSKERPIGKVKK